MSAVIIKSGDAQAIAAKVRSLDQAASPPARPTAEITPPEILSLRRDVETLSRQAQQQSDEIERLKADVDEAYAKGEAAGRKAGLLEATSREDERLSLARDSAALALAHFDEVLAELARISPLLALEGLQRVIGDPANYPELIRRTIDLQLERLGARSVVCIEVSPADFPDGASPTGSAASRIDYRTIDDLGPGQCRIKLRLGEVDVGIDQQWGKLSALLCEMSEPGSRR